MGQADFTIDDTPFAGRGFDATSLQVVSLQLEEQPPKVNSCVYSVLTSSNGAPTLTLSNGGTASPPSGPVSATVASIPADEAHSWTVLCSVTLPDGRTVQATRIIAVRNNKGQRKMCPFETNEYDPTYAWTQVVNAVVDAWAQIASSVSDNPNSTMARGASGETELRRLELTNQTDPGLPAAAECWLHSVADRCVISTTGGKFRFYGSNVGDTNEAKYYGDVTDLTSARVEISRSSNRIRLAAGTCALQNAAGAEYCAVTVGATFRWNYANGTTVVQQLNSVDVTQIDANGFSQKNAIADASPISPTVLAASQNNYNPTGLATANVIRQDASANVDVTGLQGGFAGRKIAIFNISAANTIRLTHEDAASTAANRFALPSGTNITIPVGGCVRLWYDTTSSRWRPLSKSF